MRLTASIFVSAQWIGNGIKWKLEKMKKGQESLSSISIPIVIGLIAVKILLYDSYSSTDIEVVL